MSDISSMGFAELKELAVSRGIDIKGLRSKAALIEAIEAAPEVMQAEVIVEAQGDDDPGLAIKLTQGSLQANFASLRERVEGIVAEYTDWRPDPENEEDVKQAARYRKYLNGVAKEIDERRKSVKREFLKPLEAFEAEANDIRDIAKRAASRMKEAEVAFDEARRQMKRDNLEEEYVGLIGVFCDVIPFERVLDPQWLNKSVPYRKASEELEAKAARILGDYQALQELNLPNQPEAERKFFETLDLGEAGSYAKEQQEAQRRIEEAKAEAEWYEQGGVGEITPEAMKAIEVDTSTTDVIYPLGRGQEHVPVCPQPEYEPPKPPPLSTDEARYRFTIEVPRSEFVNTINEARALKNHLRKFGIEAEMTKSQEAVR